MASNREKFLLSVDNGGTYIKAALIDLHGNQFGIAKHFNKMLHDHDGYAEYDLEDLWQTNCRCIREVLLQTGVSPEQIACVGFAGQGKGIYPVDENGHPFMRAISSSDTRSYKYGQIWLQNGVSQLLYPKLYQNATASQPACILAWLKDHQPENYRRIRWVFSMKDYLLFRMTGNATAGKGSQSGTCLVNLNTGEYDEELLSAYGIPEIREKLAPMVWDTEICGEVRPEAAELCGLNAGTPVSAGMFDVDASAIAMGVIDSSSIFTIAGTNGVSGYIDSKPVTNGSIALNSLYSLPGTYLIEEGSPASAGALEWVLDVLFDRKREDSAIYDQINSMVESLSPAQTNLVFLPYLTGSSESPISRGGWIGLRPEHTRAHMLRAVYEGVAFVHAIRIGRLLQNREKPQCVRMAGGATNSKPWVQMFADVLNLPVEACAREEMGAKGVAICSSVAAGLYPDIRTAVDAMKSPRRLVLPRPEVVPEYAEKFQIFQSVADKMHVIWPEFLHE